MYEAHHRARQEDRPGRDLASTLARFDRHRRTLDDRATLNMADMRILWLFNDSKPRALRAIAQELGLEQSTVNRQVNAALEAGYLSRHRDAGAATYLFSPTAAGVAAFEKNLEATIGAYDTALARLGTDDATHLLTLFANFVDVYEQIAESPN